MKHYKLYSILFLTFLFSFSFCKAQVRPEKNPVDEIISQRKLIEKGKPFAITLYDMNIDASKGIYQHRYQIIENPQNSTIKPIITKWINVSERFAGANIDNMGMQLAYGFLKPDGSFIISKIPVPPGYYYKK